MCILFFNINSNASPGEYRLILAANRDEFYKRPAQQAGTWKEEPDIIAGKDMEKGREGGTWLGMSKTGKIAVLLNVLVLTKDIRHDATGRGGLVLDFIRDRDRELSAHLHELAADSKMYNFFSIVCLDIKKEGVRAGYVSNVENEVPAVLPQGTHAFGNSVKDRPLKKVREGKKRFQEIIDRYGKASTQKELVSALLSLLKDPQKHFPCDVLQTQGADRKDVSFLSSAYVFAPDVGYGTRTHTVILVDSANKVIFSEWTMKEPIDANRPQWLTMQEEFTVRMDT